MSSETKLYSSVFVYLVIAVSQVVFLGLGGLLVNVGVAGVIWIIIARIAKPTPLVSFLIFAALSIALYLVMLLGNSLPK